MKRAFSFTALFSFLVFLCCSAQAQQFDWEWQNPKPTGLDYNDAIVFGPSKMMLFGNGGVVMTSTDGGNTWDDQYIDPDGRSIYSAVFPTANLGIVAGTSGLAYRTTDGGATWQDLNLGVTTTLWDAHFIDANTLFIVGASGNIWKSTDAGVTWANSTYGTSTLYKLHFINATDGYLGSLSSTTGRLIKTTDGGATWTNITANVTGLSGTVRGIHFVDANTGWISNSSARIYKTTDAGATWTEQANPLTSGTIYEIKFRDANNGVGIAGSGQVLTTTDGGTNWNLIQTGADKNLYGLGLSGINTEAGTDPILAAGDAGSLVVSTDNGTTWTSKFTAATQEILRRIYFPTNTTGYAVGGTTSGTDVGDILKTTDGGVTWTRLPYYTGYRNYSVYFVDENVGYVGRRGPDGIFKTTDGGSTWTQLNPGTGSSTNIWYDLKFQDANTGIGVMSNGSIAKTTDGGTTWSTPTSGFGTSAIYEISRATATTFYIVGSGGRVSKSTDAGDTWTLLTTPFTNTLYSANFLSENVGFAVGSSGKIFKTTDGGTTWEEKTSGVTSTLYSVKFPTPDYGWVGGSGGTIIYTTDGGETWVPADNNFGIDGITYDIYIRGTDLWLCGSDGMIVKGFSDPNIPVELASFTAAVSGNSVSLNWETASEINNSGFEVERKTANSGWNKLAFVQGNGTSTERHYYSYEDASLETGTYFYRLKQVDFNGSFEYSNEIKVNVNVVYDYALDQNYPNPFNPATTIRFTLPEASVVSVKVFNSIGQEIAELVNGAKDAGEHLINVDASEWSSGVYFYKINAGEFVSVKKMILLK